VAELSQQNAEQLDKAQAAFAEAATAGMQPTLVCDGFPRHQLAEFSIGLNPNPMAGLIHEELEEALKIATRNGGRCWLGANDKLSIAWPLPEKAPGPVGQDEQGPAGAAKRAAHGPEGAG
jgi:hypothetical protein